MKIQSIELENFGSYKHVKFEFERQGLSLIQGPTGSGKSTICDAVPWALFGKTAKNGTVDEVCTWPGDKITRATIWLDIGTIARRRGKNVNDLMFWPVDGVVTRGKDLNDTQKMINKWLGIDAELFLAGAYYHEFSPTAGFFTANAKTRRAICEQLVDLTLAVKIQAKLKDEFTQLRLDLKKKESQVGAVTFRIEFLAGFAALQELKAETWQKQHESAIDSALQKHDEFERNRKKIISNKCNSCGTVLTAPKEVVDDSKNPYIDRLEQLSSQVNPHSAEAADVSQEVADLKFQLKSDKSALDRAQENLADAEQLAEITSTYRAVAINNTISYIESETNRLLMDHFDAEIQVKFEVEAADKLDVQIYRGENLASFTQLSKGQRQLLKLCFGVSVMQAVQNHHGVRFHQVFIDEATDGLDEQMKVKAFKLLEKLTQIYDDVFLVEHSEALKSLFVNKYTVELINGNSEIAKTF